MPSGSTKLVPAQKAHKKIAAFYVIAPNNGEEFAFGDKIPTAIGPRSRIWSRRGSGIGDRRKRPRRLQIHPGGRKSRRGDQL